MLLKPYWAISALCLAMTGCLAPVGSGVLGERRDELADAGADETIDGGTPDDPNSDDAGPSDDSPSTLPDAGAVATPDAGADSDASAALPCDFRMQMQHCGACHSSGLRVAGLDLLSPDLEERVVDVASRSTCGSGKLVDLSAPERSVLYVRISTDDCGVSTVHRRMESEQACVLSWIQSL